MTFIKNRVKSGKEWLTYEGTTESGIRYDSTLSGPNGAHFTIMPILKKHTDKDTASARAELRRDRDVVSLSTLWVDKYV